MLLSAATTRVELTVLGYQYPAITDDEWDSNWLNIQIHAQDERGSWTATDPCLLTTDLTYLAEWFEATASRQSQQRINFLEPNLAFEIAAIGDEDVTVRCGSSWNADRPGLPQTSLAKTATGSTSPRPTKISHHPVRRSS